MQAISALTSRIELIQSEPTASAADLQAAVDDVMRYKVAGLWVCSGFVAEAVQLSRRSFPVGALVGFPHGTTKPVIKAIEATGAIKDGATALAIVPRLTNLLRRDLNASKTELMEIVRAARAARAEVFINVILETALLIDHPDAETTIAFACRATRESGCDGVMSSTGFDPTGGATVGAVRLMKAAAQELRVTASGAIEDASTARALLNSGADRVCTYSAAAIAESARTNTASETTVE